MKKLLAVVLSIVLCLGALSLTACGTFDANYKEASNDDLVKLSEYINNNSIAKIEVNGEGDVTSMNLGLQAKLSAELDAKYGDSKASMKDLFEGKILADYKKENDAAKSSLTVFGKTENSMKYSGPVIEKYAGKGILDNTSIKGQIYANTDSFAALDGSFELAQFSAEGKMKYDLKAWKLGENKQINGAMNSVASTLVGLKKIVEMYFNKTSIEMIRPMIEKYATISLDVSNGYKLKLVVKSDVINEIAKEELKDFNPNLTLNKAEAYLAFDKDGKFLGVKVVVDAKMTADLPDVVNVESTSKVASELSAKIELELLPLDGKISEVGSDYADFTTLINNFVKVPEVEED